MTIREYVDALTKIASEQVGWDTEVKLKNFKWHGFDGEEPGHYDTEGPEVSKCEDTGETVVELR